jgi:hypothetical protein
MLFCVYLPHSTDYKDKRSFVPTHSVHCTCIPNRSNLNSLSQRNILIHLLQFVLYCSTQILHHSSHPATNCGRIALNPPLLLPGGECSEKYAQKSPLGRGRGGSISPMATTDGYTVAQNWRLGSKIAELRKLCGNSAFSPELIRGHMALMRRMPLVRLKLAFLHSLQNPHQTQWVSECFP